MRITFLVARQALLALVSLLGQASPPERLSLPTDDGGLIEADVFGRGRRGVVLAHGGQFDKESWDTQPRALAAAGLRAVAINFRGYGRSRGPGDQDPLGAPLHLDVMAAVRHLRQTGAEAVSVVGASMGGSAAVEAALAGTRIEIDRLALLGASGSTPLGPYRGRTLFIVAEHDASGSGPRLPGIRRQFDSASEPKELIVLEGSAHAQVLFATKEADRIMREILRFLTAA
jgi:pimeloyl-ACP methyl ester carboxylesterase